MYRWVEHTGELELSIEARSEADVFADGLAVASEGAGRRVGERIENGVDVSSLERLLLNPALVVMSGATAVFSNHGPPPPIVERIGRIAPRPVFLIYADPGMGGENVRQARFYAAAGKPKQIWRVPGSKHTGGVDAQPAEYERRVVAFFDRALLAQK